MHRMYLEMYIQLENGVIPDFSVVLASPQVCFHCISAYVYAHLREVLTVLNAVWS